MQEETEIAENERILVIGDKIRIRLLVIRQGINPLFLGHRIEEVILTRFCLA